MDTVNKHNDFVQEYKQEFENDLNPESRNFPSTLAELTEKLKAWKTILQRNVEERLPSVMKLEEESRALREFHVLDVEVPGQYLNDQVRPHQSLISWHRCFLVSSVSCPLCSQFEFG
jgi:transformation/transcription domain-associated protein